MSKTNLFGEKNKRAITKFYENSKVISFSVNLEINKILFKYSN